VVKTLGIPAHGLTIGGGKPSGQEISYQQINCQVIVIAWQIPCDAVIFHFTLHREPPEKGCQKRIWNEENRAMNPISAPGPDGRFIMEKLS
jgi:hypothetical protein